MSEIAEKVTWRRRGVHRAYVGALTAGAGGIRLTGRDPLTGVDVSLSLPLEEVDRVDVSDAGAELLAGGRCVVLDLAESESILVRPHEAGLFHIQLLARSLGALIHAPIPLAQGGRP